MTKKTDLDSVPRGVNSKPLGGKGPGGAGSPSTAAITVTAVALVAIMAVVFAAVSGGGGSAVPSPNDEETEIASAETETDTPQQAEPAVAQAAPEAEQSPPAVATEEQIQAVLASVQTLRTGGNAQQARAVLQSAINDYPDDPTLRLAFAELLVEQGDFESAVEQYEAAIASGPEDAGVRFAAGVTAQRAGDTERALEHFWEAHRLNPTNPDYPLFRGQAELALGKLAEAQASLVLAQQLDPDRATVWGMLAEVALRQNKAELALQHAGRARDLEPRDATWAVLQARALNRAARPGEALLVLEELPAQTKRERAVLRAFGECFGLLRRPSDAAAMYVEASEMNPSDAEFAREAAVWIERSGDPAGAVMFAQRAADLGDEVAAQMLVRLRSEAN